MQKLESTEKVTSVARSKLDLSQTIITPFIKPKKGDIQTVRQQWDGTKWYSLCQNSTKDCTERAGGAKHGFLCRFHFEEYRKREYKPTPIIDTSENEHIFSSPATKRQKCNQF